MSFIAVPEETASADIGNADFWPSISLDAARKSMRLDGTVTDERLTDALITAMSSVNDQLAPWKERQTMQGFVMLQNAPAEQINGGSIKVHRYIQAVYATATAQLMERYINFDSTNSGQKRADEQISTIDDYRRDAYWSIMDIQCKPRVVAELL